MISARGPSQGGPLGDPSSSRAPKQLCTTWSSSGKGLVCTIALITVSMEALADVMKGHSSHEAKGSSAKLNEHLTACSSPEVQIIKLNSVKAKSIHSTLTALLVQLQACFLSHNLYLTGYGAALPQTKPQNSIQYTVWYDTSMVYRNGSEHSDSRVSSFASSRLWCLCSSYVNWSMVNGSDMRVNCASWYIWWHWVQCISGGAHQISWRFNCLVPVFRSRVKDKLYSCPGSVIVFQIFGTV
jgi:hypothetical protein